MAIRVSRQNTEVLTVDDATIRTSRQQVEVLSEDDGEIRVSRQNVEVLFPVVSSTVYEKSASSTITFTGLAERDPMVLQPSATSNWSTLDGNATLNKMLNLAASSTLVLASGAEYIGPKSVSANSLIIFTHEAAQRDNVHEVAASSTINFTQETDVHGTIHVSANSIITWITYADLKVKERDAESIINFTQVATVDKIYRGFSQINFTHEAGRAATDVSASSTLDFQQSARHQPLQQNVSQSLNFTQSTWANIKNLSASSTIEFSHSNTVMKPIRVSAESEMTQSELQWDGEAMVETQIGLRHEASVIIVGQQSASSVIPFIHVASAHVAKATGISKSASSQINWNHHAVSNAIEESAISYLSLTQTAIAHAAKAASNELVLTQSAEVTIERGLTATSEIDFNQSATFTLVIGSTECQYTPFVGTSTDPDAPSPPPAEIDGPMTGIQVPFQLVYPSTGSVTDSVALSAPNLGNRDRLSFNRILREARGGTLIIFADPIWPKVQTLVLTFSGLLQIEAQELLTFIEDHLGQEIGLIDWEHRYWRGVIVTPDEPVVEDSFDRFTANFDFEGELDPAWNPQVVPAGSRYSATRSQQEDGYYVPNEPILPVTPETYDYHEAEADSAIKIGNPIYLTGAGHVLPAQANAAGTTQVAGVSFTDTSAGFICKYYTEGRVEKSDWTDITGVATLSAGVTYFLDPSVAGRITSTAPTAAGQYVVRVGRAVNTTTLDIEIELPILL